MKNLLLVLFLLGSVANAGKLNDVPRSEIKYLEVNHSENIVCAIHLQLKESQDVLVQEMSSSSYYGKHQIEFPTEALEKSNYAVVLANCGVDPLKQMFDERAQVPAWFYISVILKDGSSRSLPVRKLIFEQHHEQFGLLNLDMVKFK